MIEKVLIVDDDKMICNLMKTNLDRRCDEIVCAHSGEQGLKLLETRQDFQLCFCDMQMRQMTGLDILEYARTAVPNMLVVIMTARDDSDMMDAALNAGAFDVLVKPFTNAQAKAVLVKANRWLKLIRENGYFRTVVRYSPAAALGVEGDRLLGNSYQITRVKQLCRRAADSGRPILIAGERGTGKKTVADEICDLCDPGNRKSRLRLDCATVDPDQLERVLFGIDSTPSDGPAQQETGLLEIADGAFLMLENLTALSIPLQRRLTRFIDTGTYTRACGTIEVTANVRILATTRAHLRREVDLDRFHAPLFDLLKPLAIDVPPLRDRGNDVTVVGKKILKRLNAFAGRDLSFSAQALDRMQVYQWPGNVAELERLVQRLILVAPGPIITAEDLPNEVVQIKPVTPAIPEVDVNRMFNIRDIERLTIIRALKETKGNRSKAAELLGFTSRTLRNKLMEYNEAGIWDDGFDPKKRRSSRS